MAVVDLERKLQEKVKHWLVDDLGYTYLGNLTDQDNTPVKEDLLQGWLEKRGYGKEQISRAIWELENRAGNQTDTLYEVNKAVYELLRYGLPVKDSKGNRPTVHYIDWKDVSQNDFYVAEEVSVIRADRRTRKRPDLVLYVNGIALGMIELKRSCVSVGEGIRQMLTNQKKENIAGFFSTQQLLMSGNEGQGLRYGVVGTEEKFYLTWKEDKKAVDGLSVRIREIQAQEPDHPLRDGLVSLCQKERFLSLIHDFIIFDAGRKKTARHNQYFANLAARERIKRGEGGIIWNTQGSGKSLIMVWLTKWIIEQGDNHRVVIITDREELDDQIESLFQDVGEKNVRRTKSCADSSFSSDLICFDKAG